MRVTSLMCSPCADTLRQSPESRQSNRGRPAAGATINLVQRDGLDGFCQSMSRRYEETSGIDMAPLVCQVVDGAD